MRLRRTVLGPNTSTFLLTFRPAAEAHLAEGQFFTWGPDIEQSTLWCTEQELEDLQFPEAKGRIYSQGKLE
jgi:hypothetical protein